MEFVSNVSGLWGSWRTRASRAAPPHQVADKRLAAYQSLASEAGARQELERLLVEVVGPAVRRRLYLRLPEEAEELYGLASARVVERLRAWRDGVSGDPILNLEAYAVTVAEHIADDALRARNPERARLKNRLRYLLETSPSFALWEESGRWVGGMASRQGQGPRPLPTYFAASQALPLSQVCQLAFEAAGGCVALEELVSQLAHAWGYSELPIVESDLSEECSLLEQLPDGKGSPEDSLHQRERLSQLWQEIRQLPERQRIALLLNLRDDGGRGVIELLLTQVPRLEIEAAAGLWSEEERALWESLPLDDNAIAERLGVTRQQVINLRKVARERLRRHLMEKRHHP